jgi:hypothetical protein
MPGGVGGHLRLGRENGMEHFWDQYWPSSVISGWERRGDWGGAVSSPISPQGGLGVLNCLAPTPSPNRTGADSDYLCLGGEGSKKRSDTGKGDDLSVYDYVSSAKQCTPPDVRRGGGGGGGLLFYTVDYEMSTATPLCHNLAVSTTPLSLTERCRTAKTFLNLKSLTYQYQQHRRSLTKRC